MPVKTRNNSKSQERRNSVSEITEYFQSVHEQNTNSTAPSAQTKPKPVKVPNKEKFKTKDKDKEKIKGQKQLQDEKMPSQSQSQGDSEEPIEGENTSAISASKSSVEPNCNHDKEADVEAESTPKDKDNYDSSDNLKDATTQTNEDVVLQALQNLQQKLDKIEDDLHLPKNGISDQLAKTSEKTQNLYTELHSQVNRVLVRLDQVTKTAADNDTNIKKMEIAQQRMSQLLDENKRLVRELQLMKDLVQKVTQQNQNTSTQLMHLSKRGMEQNLIVYGVDDALEVEDAKAKSPQFTPKERCQHSALEFFKKEMRLDLEVQDIWKAHRMGTHRPGKVRPLILKLSYAAKDMVMENMGELKGKKNAVTDQVYFISEQIPEGIMETKKQVSARAKILRDANDKLPTENKKKIQVIQDKILVDGILDQPRVSPPQPSQLFPDSTTQDRIDALQEKIVETPPRSVKNSEFTALATKVHSVGQMNEAYIAVAQRFPTADHIMAAFAFKENGRLVQGACDDREYGAGAKVKSVIFEQSARNTAVFVVRKFGGVHLGYERFGIIQSIAKDALVALEASL